MQLLYRDWGRVQLGTSQGSGRGNRVFMVATAILLQFIGDLTALCVHLGIMCVLVMQLTFVHPLYRIIV